MPNFAECQDFIFSNKDTIGVVLLFKYKKNDEIRVFDMLDMSEEISKFEDSNVFDSYKDVKVTHNIAVLGLRMLYTLNIEYLFYHHFFENFNLEEYKRSDYSNMNTTSDYDPFSSYKNYKKYRKAKAKNKPILDDMDMEPDSTNPDGNPKSLDEHSNVKKELFMVLDVEHPQFNFQNEASNSQLLVVGKGIMRV